MSFPGVHMQESRGDIFAILLPARTLPLRSGACTAEHFANDE